MALLHKVNNYLVFAITGLVIFSQTVFSNEDLNTLQRNANDLANGGTFLLSKSCEIDGTLLFKNKSNITINGNNLTITQLKQNTITIKIMDCNNVKVGNLVLIGDPGSYIPTKQTDSVGIYMLRCKGQHVFEGIKFYDHGFAGFEAVNVSNITIDRCLFNAEKVNVKDNEIYNCGISSYGTKSHGINMENWEIKNCLFEKTAIGIILDLGHDHLNLHDNKFTDMRGQHGMYLNASSYVNIYDNTFTNIFGSAVKLQMNNGYDEDETDITIINNTCNVEQSHNRAQAGFQVGVAKPQGPAKGVSWKNVRIENNRANRCDYGVAVSCATDANISHNELSDSVYGVLASSYSGCICDNNITNTQWSGILCEVMTGRTVDIEGNVIKGPVHISEGDAYRRCGIFLTGSGIVELENNRMYKNEGHPLYGLYQGQNITLTRYNNNRLIGPLELKGPVVSQANNEILR
ncbi:MAG: right-handed parallel beta-helix repeat-containing protein [Sedimentisphaerales bacterium]